MAWRGSASSRSFFSGARAMRSTPAIAPPRFNFANPRTLGCTQSLHTLVSHLTSQSTCHRVPSVQIASPKPNTRSYHCLRDMATPGAVTFSGNLKKAVAGIKRINTEGIRWRVFDAKGQVLGRLASQISTVIQGKDKPTYTPNREDGDICIVVNAKDIAVTGRKLDDKFYRWHTGYIGHLKERSLKDQLVKDPTQVIRSAVMRMLPRNKLRDDRDLKLRIFAESEHPFGDRPIEEHFEMPPRQVRELRPRTRRAMVRAQKKGEQQKEKGESSKSARRKKKEEEEAIIEFMHETAGLGALVI